MQAWELVKGGQESKPEEFDTTSSKVYVYQRRNVRQTEDGCWEYEERKMTHDEYTMQVEIARNRAYIAEIENALCEFDKGE